MPGSCPTLAFVNGYERFFESNHHTRVLVDLRSPATSSWATWWPVQGATVVTVVIIAFIGCPGNQSLFLIIFIRPRSVCVLALCGLGGVGLVSGMRTGIWQAH